MGGGRIKKHPTYVWQDVKHTVCQKSYPSRKALTWLDGLLLTLLIQVWQPQKWFELTSLSRPRFDVLKMKSMERKRVVSSGVCGKCGLNVLTDKQFHLCRRQWRPFPKICLDDNRGGHCFGNIGGGGGCSRWQDGGHLRATGGKSGRSIAAQTAPRCHGASEKTHKQTSTFYIYRNSLFFTRS